MAKDKPNTQLAKFKKAARDLETDDNEKRFNERLGKIASQRWLAGYGGAMSQQGPPMTDREIAVATFRAVAALHYAVTGKPLSLSVETEAGTIKIIEGERPPPTSDPVECSHRQ